MDIVKVFGGNLKKYRKAMGISQEAFADKCGMHRTYICIFSLLRSRISRRYPLPRCSVGGTSLSNLSICSFNSISVIGFPIRHSPRHR